MFCFAAALVVDDEKLASLRNFFAFVAKIVAAATDERTNRNGTEVSIETDLFVTMMITTTWVIADCG
jgi:hypothetical protein